MAQVNAAEGIDLGVDEEELRAPNRNLQRPDVRIMSQADVSVISVEENVDWRTLTGTEPLSEQTHEQLDDHIEDIRVRR